MPRFNKDKDARKEELDRQAAEEVERLTRRGGPPSMGGGMGGGPGMGAPMMPSPLDRIAEELRDAPRPSMRRQAPPRRAAPQAQQAFTPMPSGSVGSSFGPGGLNPGPRGMVGAPPPPAFGGGAAYEENIGAPVTGPPVYNAEPDEDEEMSITEMALMDHAARTGHNPEDLVMQYDASSAEEMRDQAMRQFYERQQSRRPGAQSNSPFAPAGMRGGGGGPAAVSRNLDPAAAGGALAQRLANRRRREEAEARRARGEPEPGSSAAPADAGEAGDGALAKVLARRRQSLGMDAPPAPAAEPPGRRHAEEREEASPRLRSAPRPVADEPVPTLEDMAEPVPTKRATNKASAKKPPAATRAEVTPVPVKKVAAKRTKKAGATLAQPAPAPAPVRAAPVKQAAPATKSPATKSPAKTRAKAAPAAAAAKAGPKAVFCIECGEKNPAIAKFCFSCGTRLAAPEV